MNVETGAIGVAEPPGFPETDRVAEITAMLVSRVGAEAPRLAAEFARTGAHGVRCCWLDDVLPERIVDAATQDLPSLGSMLRRVDRKERKFVSAKLDTLGPTLRSTVMAFSQQPVADLVAGIMGKSRLEVDPRLYNGGVTSMVKGDFMCPHLDNSHDYDRKRRREVVVLYYLSPDWDGAYGGGLELWSRRRGGQPHAVAYRANRLVILETTESSWHSIRPIVGPAPRNSLTTYYYAPATEHAPLRLTRFTGWPDAPVTAALFSAEFHLRNVAARVLRRRLRANQHVYQPTSPSTPAGPHAS